MSHHRALVITLVAAVVIAAVGIGVLALSDDDSPENDASVAGSLKAGEDGDGFEPNTSRQTINVWLSGTDGVVNVKAVNDGYPQCVVADSWDSPGNVKAPSRGPNVIQLGVETVGGAFEECGYIESHMSWLFTTGNGEYLNVELHKSPGGDPYAKCAARTGGPGGWSCETTNPPRESDTLHVNTPSR